MPPVAKRQISEDEKRAVLVRQGLKCFIDGHPIESSTDVEFDHIHPYAGGGRSDVANIGVLCRKHNREKGTMLLGEYRDRLELRRFFEGAKNRKLDDLLEKRLGGQGFAQPLATALENGQATLFFASGPVTVPVAQDHATGESYFYATVPVAHVQNDTELQPRSLEPDRLWELYRHLLTHTQLAPAVCRLVGDRLLLFDGQHKVAAQVWAGRRHVDCKVYINPDVRQLAETNLAAHDKLRQMPFYTGTLLQKFATMAGEDWEEFLKTTAAKTETNFVDFLRARGLTKAEAVKRVRSMIYQDILDHPENRLREYIAEENRSRQNPLTMSRLERTFFAEFVAPAPLADEFETDPYHRDQERENIVKLFNLIVSSALDGSWAPERNDDAHRKAARLFSAGSLRAWVPLLKHAIAPTLLLFTPQQQAKIFYRELSEEQFDTITGLVNRLLGHKIWVDTDPTLHDLRYDNAERAAGILESQGLTVTWLIGAGV